MSEINEFDELTCRLGTTSYKWEDEDKDILPMWVADMDFKTAPCVIEAIKRRADHGIFGYSYIPEEWQNAYQKWWQERHHFTLDKDALIFSTGVIPILSSVVRKLTTPAEKVLIQTPVYNMFYNSILNQGRNVVESPLVYQNGKYEIDFEDLAKKLADPQVSMMFLCNPHNPVGKIWSKEDLSKIAELCAEHNVIVVSDEIHCDLTNPNLEYIPFASVSDAAKNNSISCYAPTKTFNLAGIHSAAAYVPNRFLRHKVWRGLNSDEVAEPNAIAIWATIAAFNEGRTWLDNLRSYLANNKELVKEYFKKEIPELKVISTDATYLLWIDCRELISDTDEFADLLFKECRLRVAKGTEYGKAGEGFIRLNIATQKARVIDALARFKQGADFVRKLK